MIAPSLDALVKFFGWVLHVSLEASVLTLAVLAVQFLFQKRLSPRWRYALWFLVMARLVIPALPQSPVSVYQFLHWPTAIAADTAALADANAPLTALPQGGDSADKAAFPVKPPGTRPALPQLCAMLWATVAVLWAVTLLICHVRFLLSLRSARRPDNPVPADLFAGCIAELGIARRVRLLETTAVGTPAVFGLFRPTLLLPAGLDASLSREELRMVFLHELAHVQRADLLINTLLTALQVLHWFNPVLWLAFHRMRFDRECATDSLVLSGSRAELRDLYGHTLLKLVEVPFFRQPRLIGIVEGKKRLARRFRLIREASPSAYGWSVLGSFLFLILAATTLTRSSASVPQSPGTTPPAPPEQAAAKELTAMKMETDPIEAAMRGGKLTAEQVAAKEREVTADPARLDLRMELLGYYFTKRVMQKEARDAAQPHVLWIISNVPASSAAGTPFTQVQGRIDPVHYVEARDAWKAQVAKHPSDVAILGNAAAFLLLNDPQEAEKLLLEAKKLDPDNAGWSQRLGQFYALQSRGPAGGAFPDAKKDAFKEFAIALKGAEGEKRFYLLPPVAEAALNAGDLSAAKTYAEEMLRTAPGFKTNWNYGNVIYSANSVLGMLALKEGDTAAAEKYLLAAGNTPGSPQLDSFGPSLSLAQQLVDLGRTESVVTFLDEIARFWKGKEVKIRQWQDAIRRGEKPRLKQFG